MTWQAAGAIFLVMVALGFVTACVAWRLGGQYALERARLEQSERRSERRADARRASYAPRHTLKPWPGPEQDERLTTTGELRALSESAEAGDLAEIGRQNAAFFRRLDLRRWTRAA